MKKQFRIDENGINKVVKSYQSTRSFTKAAAKYLKENSDNSLLTKYIQLDNSVTEVNYKYLRGLLRELSNGLIAINSKNNIMIKFQRSVDMDYFRGIMKKLKSIFVEFNITPQQVNGGNRYYAIIVKLNENKPVKTSWRKHKNKLTEEFWSEKASKDETTELNTTEEKFGYLGMMSSIMDVVTSEVEDIPSDEFISFINLTIKNLQNTMDQLTKKKQDYINVVESTGKHTPEITEFMIEMVKKEFNL